MKCIGAVSYAHLINDKFKEIIYQTQKSVDEDELTFKQSIAKSKECYVLLRVVVCGFRGNAGCIELGGTAEICAAAVCAFIRKERGFCSIF